MYEEIFLQASTTDSFYQRSGDGEASGEYDLGNFGPPYNYGASNGAVRFPSIPINYGATIYSAKLRLWVSGNQGTVGTIRFNCYGIKQTNVSPFTSQPFGLPRTTAVTSGSKGVPFSGTTFDIDVTSQINEIVGQAGWVSGNAMGFVAVDNGSDVSAVIYDGTLSSQLEIHFTATPNLFPTPVSVSAPTFPAASDYGVRVSEPGVDVRSATEKQLYFTSRKKELRVNQELETTLTQFAHGLSYAPCVLGYYTDTEGRHIINYGWNVFQAGAAILSDATNVYISYENASPSYCYVFIDPLT